MEAVLENLAQAIEQLNINKVPPPMPYNGEASGTSIEDFFVNFERYAHALYQDEYASYLQILPSYVVGESRDMVLAFGSGNGVTYQIVKDKLIDQINSRKTIGSNKYTDFFSAKRRPNESLVCYSIRLQTLATKMPNASQQTKDIMVKSKFLSSLNTTTARQVDITLSSQPNPTLDQIVKLASILESDAGVSGCVNVAQFQHVTMDDAGASASYYATNAPFAINPVSSGEPIVQNRRTRCFACQATDHLISDCPVAKATKCYNCSELGHIARNCKQPRKSRNAGQSHGVGGSGAPRSRSNQGPIGNSTLKQCAFCGTDGHLMMDCRLFKVRMTVCCWCGENHASHQCQHKPKSGN